MLCMAVRGVYTIRNEASKRSPEMRGQQSTLLLKCLMDEIGFGARGLRLATIESAENMLIITWEYFSSLIVNNKNNFWSTAHV